jgi:hypothetical protein
LEDFHKYFKLSRKELILRHPIFLIMLSFVLSDTDSIRSETEHLDRMDGKRQRGKMSKTRIWGEDEHVRLKLRVRTICTSIYPRFQHFYSSTFVLFFLSIFFHHTSGSRCEILDPAGSILNITRSRFIVLTLIFALI